MQKLPPPTPRYPTQKSKNRVPHLQIPSADDAEVVYEGNHEKLMEVENTSAVYVSPTKKNELDTTGIYEEETTTTLVPEHAKTFPRTLLASIAIVLSECILIILYCAFLVPILRDEQRDSQGVVQTLWLLICDLVGCTSGLITALLGIAGSLTRFHWTKQVVLTHCFLCGLCVNLVLCLVSGILGMIVLSSIMYVFMLVMVIDFAVYSIAIYYGLKRVKAIKLYMGTEDST
jgi:hypothetical protein